MAAPEAPSATAWAGDCSPNPRRNAPKVKSAGSRLADWDARAELVDRAVRSTQRKGSTDTAIARTRRAHAPARRGLNGRRRVAGLASGTRLVVVVMRDSLVQVRLVALEELHLDEGHQGEDEEENDGDGGPVSEVGFREGTLVDVVLDDPRRVDRTALGGDGHG